MPRPNLKLSLNKPSQAAVPAKKDFFYPFSKQELLAFLPPDIRNPSLYPHLLGQSSQQQLTVDQKVLILDYLFKKEFTTATLKTLLRRGGSGGGGIYMGQQNKKVMKVIANQQSFDAEKKAAELIMTLDPSLPLPSVKAIYTSVQAIIYENKFKNPIVLETYLETVPEDDKLQLTRNLIDALQRLHDIGVYHGDIKASNIIVNPENLDIQFIDIGSMASRTSTQRIYDFSRSTISLLPPPLTQHRQMAQLHNSCTFDEKVKLDNYALYLILKDLVPMNQQLARFQKQGQQAAQKIVSQIQKVGF
jgi:hypothetical protein